MGAASGNQPHRDKYATDTLGIEFRPKQEWQNCWYLLFCPLAQRSENSESLGRQWTETGSTKSCN